MAVATIMLSIRPFRSTDEAAVIDLWHQCGLIVPQNDPHADIERKLAVSPELFLVGEWDGDVVASCMAGYEGHRGWINYLAVAPHRQRSGIASRMMARAEELLREAGCPKISLQVRSTNLEVIAFYESIGFSRDDVLSFGKRLHSDAKSCQAPEFSQLSMIRHTVVFKLIHPLGSPPELEFFEAAARLADIPGVRNFQCLREVSLRNNYDFALSMDFASSGDYESYNNHPDHVDFVRTRWIPEVLDFAEIDFEPMDEDWRDLQ